MGEPVEKGFYKSDFGVKNARLSSENLFWELIPDISR